MTVTISRRKKNLAYQKSGIPDKSGRFSSMKHNENSRQHERFANQSQQTCTCLGM